MNRIGLKLICLLVALVLWIQVASTTIIDEKVNLPLEVRGIRPGLTVAGNGLPGTVQVQLRGSKLRLMGHRYLGTSIGSVVLDLSRAPVAEPIQREIGIADVRSNLTVLGVIQPVDLRLVVDRAASRRVPVRVVTEGEPPEGRALLTEPQADPPTVMASGPERLLADLGGARTETIDLGRVRNTTESMTGLSAPPAGVQISPDAVRVTITVVPRETRAFTSVPVSVAGTSARLAASVSPSTATVVVSGPGDSLRTLAPARLMVTITLRGLGPGTHHLRGQVKLPDTFRVQSIAPEQFVVRVGRAGGGEG